MPEAAATSVSPAAPAPAPVAAKPAAPAAPAKPGTPAAPAAPNPDAERAAALTRLQTQTLTQSRQIETLTKQLDTLQKSGVNLDTLAKELRTNPTKALKSLGVEFKDLAEAIISSNEGAPDPIKDQLEALGKKATDLEQWKTDRETKEAQAALDGQIKGLKTTIKSIIDTGEQFELLKVYEGASGESGPDLVFNIMVEHYRLHQTNLSEAAAAEAAETWLLEYSEKLASTGKIQTRLKAKQEAALKAQQDAETAAKASGKGAKAKPIDGGSPAGKRPGPTLSNKDSGAASPSSDDEAIATALPGSPLWDKRVARAAAKAAIGT